MNRNKFIIRNIKIAVVILIVGISISTMMNLYPQITTAVQNYFYKIKIKIDANSTQISTAKESNSKYWFELPEGFELVNTEENKNIVTKTYERNSDYVEISCCYEDFRLSIDSEDCEVNETINILDSEGQLIEKKGITTIVFYYSDALIVIESNLSKNEIKEIAESIQD